MGIRKVLGATVKHLMGLLAWDMSRLVLLANLVAWPAAWWFMQSWLSNFSYRTAMDISVFILASLLALALALLTTLHRAWYAATANPIEALRTE